MKIVRHYSEYEKYIEFQSKKTLNPEKRKKWLNEEWRLKIDGFKGEIAKFGTVLSDNKDMSSSYNMRSTD